MTTLATLLVKKGHQVVSIAPDATVFDAIRLMDEKGIGALAVMQGNALVGIVTERDYARKVILKGRASKETRVRDIMTSRVCCASPHQTVEETMAVMTEQRVRHLPVMEGKKMLGMVSIGDVVKEIISEQKFTIDQLVHYISWEESY